VAKVTKNKESKEGRHVGFDFYDLLIEALIDPDGGFRGQILDERNLVTTAVRPFPG
jgi:hypothetical protein